MDLKSINLRVELQELHCMNAELLGWNSEFIWFWSNFTNEDRVEEVFDYINKKLRRYSIYIESTGCKRDIHEGKGSIWFPKCRNKYFTITLDNGETRSLTFSQYNEVKDLIDRYTR